MEVPVMLLARAPLFLIAVTLIAMPDPAQAQVFGDWTVASETELRLRDMIRAGDSYVAVGSADQQGLILTSPDAVLWKSIRVDSTPEAVAWNGDLYIAMGLNTYHTSTDGETWVSRHLELPGIEYVSIAGIKWIDGYFYALGEARSVSQGSFIMRSPDGISWTICLDPVDARAKSILTLQLHEIIKHGDHFVAIGFRFGCLEGRPIIATSRDGLSWSLVVDDSLPDQNDRVSDIIWDQDSFLAVGTGGTVYTSPDGISWSVDSFCHEDLVAVVQLGDQLLAASISGNLFLSRDRSTWERLPVSGFSQIDLMMDVIWTGTQLLAYDYQGRIYSLPVIMPLTARPEPDYLVPVVVRGPGRLGTTWASDLVLHNRGPGQALAKLYLLEGRPVGETRAVQLAVPAQASLRLPDLLMSSFNSDHGAGALLVAADRPLILSSRTYAPGPDGTSSQQIPGVDLSRVVTGSDPVTLIQLSDGPAFRTNLGFSSVSGSEQTIDVDLFLSDGTGVGRLSLVLPPFAHTQVGNALWSTAGITADDWFAVISSPDGDAAYFPYASRIDNLSADPIFNVPVAAADEALYIPVAAHLAGLNGTAWRTDMEICSPTGWPARARIDLLVSDQDNSTAESVWLTIDGGSCRRFQDVLDELFAFTGTAALRLTPEQGRLLVSSHTYNQRDDGSYGQLVPALATSTALSGGDEALLVQLSHSADATSGFRTNIGFASASAQTSEVQLSLYQGDGSYLGGRRLQLQPFSASLLSDVLRGVSDQDLSDAYAIVRPIGEQARVFAYASVVDNHNGDSVYIKSQSSTLYTHSGSGWNH
jgi:hypothetical protein